MDTLPCFKAYDIRGKLGDELNETVAYSVGRAFAVWLQKDDDTSEALSVVVGGDVRLSSGSLKAALANGLMDGGVDVIDLGMTGTEEIYFATFHLGVAGGVEVTASHNPIDYNGMKLVQAGAKPLNSQDFAELKTLTETNVFSPVTRKGMLTQATVLDAYIQHLLGYIQPERIQPLKLVVNAGNGAAGHVIDALEVAFSKLAVPISFIKIQHEPDGSFPHGIPNPLLPECRADTADAVVTHKADMGIAWDGDFDRCFLFDETGAFIEGYYIVGLLAEAFLAHYPNANIVHDPRLTWNTLDIVSTLDGKTIQSKTGHAFIKEQMRVVDAVYGGEMSAHHYFRDFAYCDSGMIPWLLVTELVSRKNSSLSTLVKNRIDKYPCSGEINLRIDKPTETINAIEAFYKESALKTERIDGLSMEFDNWRFNIRSSNTEPVIRVNVESRKNSALMETKTDEILELTKGERV